ncbi:lytic murein transglycosylase [Kiloniella laminariae]|uniref:lytic murein transglycosylase n=1 Tax=Kiloniella laminariae TaxID=454162 RepID=UPI00035F8768|nr:lytic murein transglycosylase [Kiloniella laminariae]
MFPSLRHVIRPALSGGVFIALAVSTAVFAEGVSAVVPVSESVQTQSFDQWLSEFKREARTKGISDKTLEESFQGVQPIPKIIEYDRRQPEFTRTFWSYLDRAVDPTRIKKAQELEQKHRVLLDQISQKYGVQKRFLLAFWGLESNFGEHTGGFSVIAANATLAYDTRRSDFFRTQLLEALKIVQGGHISAEKMTGSWAGAMGHLQFIPSTYTMYAVDENGDGRQDIWQSLPDVFGSAANYLGQIGWTDKYTWGREVRIPSDFNWDLAGLETNLPLAEWQIQGVRSIDGTNLPDAMIEASLILPAGHKGPAFLVYSNYRKILNWNRSILYAIAVGHLSDRIAGAGPLQTVRQQDERALHRTEVEEIQSLLVKQGFDVGEPDGIVGQKTREGIRAYQKKVGLPGDGYPDEDLLNRLRAS